MLQGLFSQRKNLTLSEFIEGIVKTHHRLTVIHPFGDGNGRTLRAFLNMILVRNQVSPLYIKADEKDEYVTALSLADTKDSYVQLYECIFKCLLRSNVDLNSY
jgi:Fic family protein